jgi:hypothetical protein
VKDYLLLIQDVRGDASGSPVDVQEMTKWTSELRAAGKVSGGAPPLAAEADGARVRVRDGRTLVTDGPFTESKEIVCGYNVVRAASRDEAIALAQACPYARAGQIEVREAGLDEGAPTSFEEPHFLILFREGDDPERRDGAREYQDMMAWIAELGDRYVSGAGLPRQARAARVCVRDGRAVVTDGPFAEAKELVGGLGLIRARDRAEAIALAARCPHVTWGSAEVRAIRRVPSAQ